MNLSNHHGRMYAHLAAIALILVAGPAHAAPDLDILASAGLGDDLGGRPVAIDLVDDGVVLASVRGGHGSLVRLDRSGEPSGPARTLTSTVDHLAVDRTSGDIAVVGPDGLAVFDASFEPLWQRPLTTGAGERRVAVGERGTIAALAGGTLHIFAADGTLLGEAEPGDDVTRGLAVLDAAGVVVTTGWSRVSACDRAVDVASLTAFAHDGAPRWHAYGETSALCAGHDDAHTRGIAVARGEDGLVYLLAEVEGRDDLFRSRPDDPSLEANNVAFDVYTDPETAHPQQSAYYARFTPEGRHLIGQYFLLPAAGSVVRPRAISADVHGNVYLAGAASHSLGAADEVAATEALDRMAGFYQVVEPDLEARRVWQLLDADDMRTDITALAVSGDRVVTLLDATAADTQTEGSLPTGPSVLLWPGGFGPVAVEKRPDPETQGTFGYESGVSGSDPTCYCDTSPPAPSALLALGVFALAGLRRPRRAAATQA